MTAPSLRDVFAADELEIPRRSLYEPMRELVVNAYERGLLTLDASTDDEVLSAAATVEHRRGHDDASPTLPRLTPPLLRSGSRRRSDTDVDSVEVLPPTERKRSR